MQNFLRPAGKPDTQPLVLPSDRQCVTLLAKLLFIFTKCATGHRLYRSALSIISTWKYLHTESLLWWLPRVMWCYSWTGISAFSFLTGRRYCRENINWMEVYEVWILLTIPCIKQSNQTVRASERPSSIQLRCGTGLHPSQIWHPVKYVWLKRFC